MRGPRVRVNGWQSGDPRGDGVVENRGSAGVRWQQRWHEEGDGCAAIWFPIMGRRDAPLSSEQRPGHPTPSSTSLGTMSVLVWCWCKPTQPNPPDSLSFACTSASQPTVPPPPPPAPSLSTSSFVSFSSSIAYCSSSSSSSSFSTSFYYCYCYYYRCCCRYSFATLGLPPTATYRRPLLPSNASRSLAFVLRPSKLLHLLPPPPLAHSASSEVTHTHAYISSFRPPHRCRPHFSQQSPTQANRTKS